MKEVRFWDVSANDYENNNFGEMVVEEFEDEFYTVKDFYSDNGIYLETLDNGDYTYEAGNGEKRYIRIK